MSNGEGFIRFYERTTGEKHSRKKVVIDSVITLTVIGLLIYGIFFL